jgi:hypothetical protein
VQISNSALRRLRQEEQEFETSLGYITRSYLKKIKPNHKEAKSKRKTSETFSSIFKFL